MADQSSVSPRHFEIEWGGRTLAIDIGKFAGQANGACTVRYGDTIVLATVVLSANSREGIDFFPLMVDFEERLYAAGKIKGSRFIKREGRPSDEAILSGRLIDRAIRPFFPDGIRNDVQVVITTLSWDGENDSDILGIIGASVVLSISDIPWNGLIAGIRIGRIPSSDGAREEWAINPTYAAREKSVLDLVVAGTHERAIMIEAGAKQVPEDDFRDAIAFGMKHLRPIVALITQIREQVGKPKWVPPPPALTEDDLTIEQRAREFLTTRIREALRAGVRETKRERSEFVNRIRVELEAFLTSAQVGKDKRKRCFDLVKPLVEEGVITLILDEGKRVDGRALDQIRPLGAEVALLPRTHGSGYFTRGDTRILSAVTLGAPSKEQIIDTMEYDVKKRYMHHYNFPAYSVGEAGPNRGPGRREIGHGALAERALEPVLPAKEQFPYAMRVVSETFSSNGSSSMASTCASSLALMDAGVPITAPVGGVAMGLASDAKGRWKVLTDLQDLEDGKGGMDFKIAGTKAGITAVQMDTKTAGLTAEMIAATLTQAHEARLEVLRVMEQVIASPRPELSPYAPRVQTLQIKPDRIRDVIGPGGKIINEIIDKTGAEIDIEQSGLIFITSVTKEGMDRAIDWIKQLTREVVAGEIFRGKVTRLLDFGAFVEILPKQEGLVHISELAPYRVNEVTDIVKIGDEVPVMVKEIDDLGRINLSLKAAVAAGEAFEYPPAPPDGGGFADRGTRGHGHGPSGFRGGPPHGGPRGHGGPGGPRRGPPRRY
ncbi:polyribonucleotide nucleotidyltransferase [Candidatus Uhrbacteria bacterium]|nr:polyribonucleotide nucleotidyltransferase [Candidatus Uhrbacteria bacterium]